MIAVDAMGGDNAPESIVHGALLAAKENVPINLFGEKGRIIKTLNNLEPNWKNLQISICDAPQSIGMEEVPSIAIRQKQNSSLVQAVKAVKKGSCSAVISAGNSGAFVVASIFILGRLEGIERPAIIGMLPIGKSKNVLCLDLGANADCKPEYLLKFALMADLYAKNNFNLKAPRIALLSNGQEEGKGSELVKAAFKLLKMEQKINFIGNIEPADIFNNITDIVVCDGFSGNILLKTIEACVNFFSNSRNPLGGAFLVGVKGKVVVAHGNSNKFDIKKAILLAYEKNSLRENKNYGIF